MKQVRRNVFETNSSSTHSVVRVHDAMENNELPIEYIDGEPFVVVRCDDFGWSWDLFTDAYTKLQYLCTFVVHQTPVDTESPDFYEAYTQTEEFELIRDAIYSVTGYNLRVESNDDDGYKSYGYIDHDSVHVAANIIRGGKIEDFVFNCTVGLLTGNDNSDKPSWAVPYEELDR